MNNATIIPRANVTVKAGDGGGEIYISDATDGGSILIGNGATSWANYPTLEEYDGAMWSFPKNCQGHIDIGGICVGVNRKPSFLARLIMRALGWKWVEERSDHVKRVLENRTRRKDELV